MLHLTRTNGIYSTFIQHSVKQQRSLAHMVSHVGQVCTICRSWRQCKVLTTHKYHII